MACTPLHVVRRCAAVVALAAAAAVGAATESALPPRAASITIDAGAVDGHISPLL
jgi:hypothetical protein